MTKAEAFWIEYKLKTLRRFGEDLKEYYRYDEEVSDLVIKDIQSQRDNIEKEIEEFGRKDNDSIRISQVDDTSEQI